MLGRGGDKPYLTVIIDLWRIKNRIFWGPLLQYFNPVLSPLCNSSLQDQCFSLCNVNYHLFPQDSNDFLGELNDNIQPPFQFVRERFLNHCHYIISPCATALVQTNNHRLFSFFRMCPHLNTLGLYNCEFRQIELVNNFFE